MQKNTCSLDGCNWEATSNRIHTQFWKPISRIFQGLWMPSWLSRTNKVIQNCNSKLAVTLAGSDPQHNTCKAQSQL